MRKPRLIDANALDRENWSRNVGPIQFREYASELIRKAPTIDVEPMRHGQWFMTEYFTCSVCGQSYYNGCDSTKEAIRKLKDGDYYQYCPNCGAKMDSKD